MNLGFTDAIRAVSDDPGIYTFWDYQAGGWQKNNGIRIDHLLLSPPAAGPLPPPRVAPRPLPPAPARRPPPRLGGNRQRHAPRRQALRSRPGGNRARPVSLAGPIGI